MRIDDECTVKKLAGRRLVFRTPKYLISFCHPVPGSSKGPEIRTIRIHKMLPREGVRRVGAGDSRNQSRADRAEQRQVAVRQRIAAARERSQ